MDETEPRWKAQLDGWVADRQLGKVLGRLYSKVAEDDPAYRGALEEAVEKIRQAEANVLHAEVTAIMQKANRLTDEANRLSEDANRLALQAIRESKEANQLALQANQGSKQTRWIAWLSFAIAMLALAAQIYPLVFSQPAAVP